LDLAGRGEEIAWEVVLADQNERDRRDENREVGPLRRAPDAIEFRTDGLDQEEVVAQLVTFVQSRQPS
jgi:cytidylate kinase